MSTSLASRRWSARLGLALLVALLSTGMVAQQSRADVNVLEVIADAAGKVKGAAPNVVRALGTGAAAETAEGLGVRAAAGLVCASGVGCLIIGAAGVATALYGTQDYWLPWLQAKLKMVDGPPSPDGTTDINWSSPPTDGMTSIGIHQTVKSTVTSTGMFNADQVTVDYWCNGTKASPHFQSAFRTAALPSSVYWPYVDHLPFDYTISCSGGAVLTGLHAYRTVDLGGGNYVNVGYLGWGEGDAAGVGQVTVHCKDDTTGAVTDVVGTSDLVVDPGLRVKACPAGSHAVSAAVAVGPDLSQLQTQGTLPSAVSQDSTDFPACVTAGMSTCSYSITVDGTTCTVGAPDCVSWTKTAQTAPSRVRCWYGPYNLPLSDCSWMERAYDTVTHPATSPNTDGNPDTYTPPAPATSPSPSPTSTATATATVTDSPSPSPTTSATAPPDTGTSGGTAGQPSTSDVAGQACWPNGWAAFNPAEWVLQPLRCAFIPSSSAASARAEILKQKLQRAGPGPIISAMGDNFSALSAGGCSGPTIPFDLEGVHQDMQFFNACSGAMATAAGYIKALSSVVIVVSGGAAIARALASAFGLSFSMGRGGSDDA